MSKRALLAKHHKASASPRPAVTCRPALERRLRLAGLAVALFPWLVLLGMFGHGSLFRGGHEVYKDLPGGKKCIGWRETYFCHPFAERYSPGDKSCDTPIVPQISGYCLCEDNITTARVTCGPKRFTCRQKCMELAYNPTEALELPAPISCPFEVPYAPSDFLKGMQPPPANWTIHAQRARAAVAPTWTDLHAAILRHAVNATVPSTRNATHDFVREGVLMTRSTVASVRAAVAGFKADIPPYPPGAFKGRGIVMVGGGLRYIVPAWISVHQLRHLGCTLPIEMWYPLSEYPTNASVVDAFAALGVTTRPLDFPGLDIQQPFGEAAAKADPQNMARFTIKVAALLLSSFEEVLYLDVDNIPLADPAYLLDSPDYQSTGALMWQDYWSNTMAPQAEALLGVPRALWHAGSFESGQMVVNKRRHWRGLAAAMYLNSYAPFWYEVFTCYLGKGDKETFAYGMAMVGERYSVVDRAPGSLGTVGTSMDCNPRSGLCRDEFTGNTMVQPDPSGRLLFLHANLHKWDMRLPDKFSRHYQRRWQQLQPEGVSWASWQSQHLGYDLERRVYDLIRMMRCAPWWPHHYQERVTLGDRKTPDLDGWHYLLRGIEFDRIFRQGWRGNYVTMVADKTFTGRLRHWFEGHVRPKLCRWGLSRRRDP